MTEKRLAQKFHSELCNKLYDKWTNSSSKVPTEPKEHTLERISRILISTATSLELNLPFHLRKKREAYLQVSKLEKKVTAKWHESLSSESEDYLFENALDEELSYNGIAYAEFTGEESNALSKVFLSYVFEDEKPYFGQFLCVKKEEESVWFEWLPPCTEIIEKKYKEFEK